MLSTVQCFNTPGLAEPTFIVPIGLTALALVMRNSPATHWVTVILWVPYFSGHSAERPLSLWSFGQSKSECWLVDGFLVKTWVKPSPVCWVNTMRRKEQQPGISGLKAAWFTAQHSSANELLLCKSSASPDGDQRQRERACSSWVHEWANLGTERRELERKQQQVSREWAYCSWI